MIGTGIAANVGRRIVNKNRMKQGKKVVFRHYREVIYDEKKMYANDAEKILIENALKAGYIPINVIHIKDLNPMVEFPTKVCCHAGYAGKKMARELFEKNKEQLTRGRKGDIALYENGVVYYQ